MKRGLIGLIVIALIFFSLAKSLAEPTPPPITSAGDIPDGTWVQDETVTVVGKLAVRSSDFLNRTLSDYQWAAFNKEKGNPFQEIYKTIRNIVYSLLSITILIGAFLLVFTRGKELGIKRFIIRFILTVLLVTIIYSLVVFIYQIVDLVIGFFVKYKGSIISTVDLLNVYFDYIGFIGYKKTGLDFAESSLVHVWLTAATAFTYFVMSCILLLRKILLWFFLVLSPVFPLAVLFPQLKGVAKVWIGQFSRWLLYGPIFAILLGGLVSIWKLYIPLHLRLNCATSPDVTSNIYPTAINILLGGPCQYVSLDNNLNTPDSFVQYVVALLMLWVVMLLPFLLLHSLFEQLGEGTLFEGGLQNIYNRLPLVDRYRDFIGYPKQPPPSRPAGAGMAMELPAHRHISISQQVSNQVVKTGADTSIYQSQPQTTAVSDTSIYQARPQTTTTSQGVSSSQVLRTGANTSIYQSQPQTTNIGSANIYTDILNLTNIDIPTIQQIARYEIAQTTSRADTSTSIREVSTLKQTNEILKRIAGEGHLGASETQQRLVYSKIREKLETEKTKNNSMARTILTASTPTTAKGLPEVNQIQTVNVSDYETAKKTWKETYQKAAPPTDASGKEISRKEWLKTEKDKVDRVIPLIQSTKSEEVEKGKQMLSQILPFLLLGGFSRTEIIAYLIAKQTAAKETLSELESQSKEEESLIEVGKQKKEGQKQMTMEAHAEEPSGENPNKATPAKEAPPKEVPDQELLKDEK